MVGLGEIVGRVLEFFAKYAFAGAVLASFILFLPDDLVGRMGLVAIRDSNKGVWWIVLIVCATLSAQVAMSHVLKVCSSLATRLSQSRFSAVATKERIEQINANLSSLSRDEKNVVIYCLSRQQRTITTYPTFSPVIGLVALGLMRPGGGGGMDIVFVFPDEVWGEMQKRSHEFLSDGERIKALENYARNIRRPY